MKNRLAYIALSVSLILWASAFPGVKVTLDNYAPVELAAFRFLIASLALACFAPWIKVRLPRPQDIPLISILGFIGVACYHIALNYGASRATAGAAAFIANVAPVFTAVLACLFLGETVTRSAWVGLVVSLWGVGLIASAQDTILATGSATIVLLTAAICWSLFLILQKRLLTFYSPLEVICYAVWTGTAFLSIFLPQALSSFIEAPWSSTLCAAYLGLFPTAIGYVLWAYVLTDMQVSRATMYTYLVPVLSTGISILWLGERPSLLFGIGGAAVILGVIFGTKQNNAVTVVQTA